MGSVYSKITWRLLPLLIVIYLFAYIDRTVVGFAKLQMSVDIGLSDAAFGFGAGVFFVGYALFEVPSNLVLTRVGPRRWFARIMISWGVVTIAMALTESEFTFYALRFLLGVAEAGFYPGILYLITRWYPSERRARIVGLFLLANPIALAIGGPLSGAILGIDGFLGLAGWQWLFILVGIPPVVLAFVVLARVPDTPADARWLTTDEVAAVQRDLVASDLRTGATDLRRPLHVLRDGRVWLLALFFVAYSLIGYGLGLWLPQIIADTGVGTLATGWLSTLPWIAAVLALLVVPRTAERTGTPYLHMWVTLALAAAGFTFSAVLTQPALQMLFLCVAAFGVFAGQPIFWSLPSQILTGTGAAAGLAMVNTLGATGGFLGPFGVGYISEVTGDPRNGLFFLVGFAVYAMTMLIFVRRMMLRRGAQSPRENPDDVVGWRHDDPGGLMTHDNDGHEMTDDEKRHDQLTSAPAATEADAAPRIEVTEHDGHRRIDVRDDAEVRPGPGPGDPALED